MLLGANNSLENKIVLALSKEGHLTTKQIHELLTSNNISIQAIYKSLKKLQCEGIITKVGKLHSIRIPWLLNLSKLTTQLQHTYSEKQYAHTFLPKKEGERKSWKFNDLLKMCDFWSHILLILGEFSISKKIYEYSPHSWFHITQPVQEDQFLQSLSTLVEEQYSIIGGRSNLDIWIADQYWNINNYKYHLSQSEKVWPENDRSKYINVTDEYILTVRLTRQTANQIDNMYSDQKTTLEPWSSQKLAVFKQQTSIRITIEKNKTKAETFKKRFKRGFGLKKI